MSMMRASTPDRIAPLANHTLPMLLLRLREVVLLYLRPVIRTFDLTEQQARVLIVLGEAGPLEAGLLAETCAIQPPSLSRMLPRLRARGLIDRQVLPSDQRRLIVSLQPDGERLVGELRDALRRAYEVMLERIGRDRVDSIRLELQLALSALGNPSVTTEAATSDPAGGVLDGDGFDAD